MSNETAYSVLPVYRSPLGGSAIVSISFSPDGRRLAFGDASGRLIIIRDISGSQTQELDVIPRRGAQISALRWRPLPGDATSGLADLMAGDTEGYIHVLRQASASMLSMRVHVGCVEDIAHDRNENLVATASAQEACLWKIRPDGRFESLALLRFPNPGLLQGIRSLGFGPTYVHVADESHNTYSFDKWTGVLKESSIIEATELRDIIWIGHNTPRNTACFAFNDRGKGFVYQDGDRRISLEHPPGETRSSVLAVNSGSTELVGGGANRRVLVFNLPSGKRVQHLADNPTEAPGWITCIAVGKANADTFVAAGMPAHSSDPHSAVDQFRVVVWMKTHDAHHRRWWRFLRMSVEVWCIAFVVLNAAVCYIAAVYYFAHHI